MPLRFSDASEFNVWLKFQADTSQAEQQTRQLGQAANEVTSEQFQQMMTSQAGLVNSAKEYEKQTRQIQVNWWRTQRVLRASQFIFRDIVIAGTALWAPIIAGAQSYAKQIEKMDDYTEATAEAWLAQTRQLENARLRIGRVSAQVLQPYLEDVTRLANQAAGFIERHPGLIEAALKTGVAVTTVGVLGTLVTQGVKLVVDVKFVAASATIALAARQMDDAANKMLAASTGQQFGLGVGTAASRTERLTALLERYLFTTPFRQNVAGRWYDPRTGRYVSQGAVTGSRLASGAAGLAGIGAGITAIDLSYQIAKGLRDAGLGNIASNFAPLLGVAGPIASVGTSLERLVNGLNNLDEGAKKGSEAVVNFAVDMERLQREGEGTRIILQLQRDLAESARKYAEDRKDAIEGADAETLAIQNRYSDRITDAWRTMVDSIEDITRNYNKQAARDQEDYLEDRRKTVKDANKRAQDEEAKFQERLRQLRLDHEERVDELVRARDALGLVKEERRYQREVDEATRAHQLVMQRERRETVERLQEIDRRYAIERRRRYEDYVNRIQEEQERYEKAKEEAAKQREEELQANREALKDKLDELRVAYEQEKREAVNAAYEKVVLLRGAYDAELRLRQQYHGLILQSTDEFLRRMLESFQINMNNLQVEGTVPTRQAGGYSAGTGLHRLHMGEYVMSRNLTSAAEKALGGRLTNQRLMSALTGGGGTVFNFEFPGGFVTRHELRDAIHISRAELLNMLERELG